jgi:hypothetical protein
LRQHRQNRFDQENDAHVAVHGEPARWTRASRRAAGYRDPVWADQMRAFYSQNSVLPRAVRRLMRDPVKAQVRMQRKAAKVLRIMEARA